MPRLTKSQNELYERFRRGMFPATPDSDPLKVAYRAGSQGARNTFNPASLSFAAYLAGAERQAALKEAETVIKISKQGDRYLARFPYSFEIKEIVKGAGFRWSPDERVWWTRDATAAARFDGAVMRDVQQTVAASQAVAGTTAVPAPAGLAYLPYQVAGVEYMLGRDNTLMGDQMGLGKTIQAIGLINADASIKRVLVICPASLKVNWARELNKWLVTERSVAVADARNWPEAEIVITNYENVGKLRSRIDVVKWDLLIVDEVHYLKSAKAQRTVAVLGNKDAKPIQARRRVFMSGTPIVNRPAELWTLIRALDPHGLGSNFFKFHKRYTDARHNGYGWDFSGASNLPELQTKLRGKFMIRRLKDEVLTELPPKRRQVVILPPNGASAVVERERQAFAKYRQTLEQAEQAAAEAKARGDKDGYAAAIRALHAANKWAFEEMSEIRRKTAIAKIPYVIEHLQEVLEAEDKVVVFVHHHAVAHALKAAFPSAALVTGETQPNLRMDQVDRFQQDADCKLFIGSIQAAGIGLTLTAAQTVIFAELDWVPGNISQAEDRLHRIGQLGSVLVQHLVFDDSIDSYLAQTIIAKQVVIESALDRGGVPLQRAEVPTPPPPAPRPVATSRAAPRDDREIPF